MTKYAQTEKEFNTVIRQIEEIDDLLKTKRELTAFNMTPGEGYKPLMPDVAAGDGNGIYGILMTKLQTAVAQAQKEYAYARYLFDRK